MESDWLLATAGAAAATSVAVRKSETQREDEVIADGLGKAEAGEVVSGHKMVRRVCFAYPTLLQA